MAGERKTMGGKIVRVLPNSVCRELGIEAGDELLAINGRKAQDLIDYNYVREDEYIELAIRKPTGETWSCRVEKEPEEELGLVFSAEVFDQVRRCRNHCLFCFIDQLQPQPRPSLLVKDDDYRMSFLEGNFITCTNLREEDYRRIGRLKLSPLYVSVHTVDPLLRQRMLGQKGPAEILLTLQRLISLGCTLHCQIVLCPDINDGQVLDATLEALAALAPGVATVAVVPVGLTRYQKNPHLRLCSREEAAALVDRLTEYQRRFLLELGTPLVFPADELYIRAGRPFPQAILYGGFEQIENGVGMATLFLTQWEISRLRVHKMELRGRTAIVTGICGAAVLGPVVADINRRGGLNVDLVTVENSFYGPSVTASGLLTATCIRQAVRPGQYDDLLLTANMVKFDQDLFLDDCSVEQLEKELRCHISLVGAPAADLVTKLLALERPQGGAV